jgi:hypothetical protein
MSNNGNTMTNLPRKERDEKSPVWDISQERSFIENLCNQRFNFFIVFFSVILVGIANAKTMIVQHSILLIGTLIAFLLFLGLCRVYHKLNIIIEIIYEDESHPSTIVNKQAKGFGVRWIYSYAIPILCLLVLFIGIIMSFCGCLEAVAPTK